MRVSLRGLATRITLCAALLVTACTAAPVDVDEPPSTTEATQTPTSSTIDSGRILFSIESGQQGTSVPASIDATGFHEIDTPPDGSFGHAVWGVGDEIVFDSERAGPRHLFRMSIDGGETVQLTDGSTNQMGPDVSPHGGRVVFEAWNDEGDLGFFTVDLHGGAPQSLISVSDAGPAAGYVGFTEATYSPDGRWIAFTRVSEKDGSRSAIFVVRTDGNDMRRLTNDALAAGDPRWSPDGKTILFHSNLFEHGGDGSSLWTVTSEGGKAGPLSSDYPSHAWASEGAWSPDGTQIVFRYYESGSGSQRTPDRGCGR